MLSEINTNIFIEQEPRGETYQALLRFAASRCQRFSLVWRDQHNFKPEAQEVAATLEPYLVSQVHTDNWPGTRLFGHKATVRYYQLNRQSVAVLQGVEGLYSWLTPNLPEDIAFYSSGEILWLGTISHEEEAWFKDKSLSRIKILEHIPGIILCP